MAAVSLLSLAGPPASAQRKNPDGSLEVSGQQLMQALKQRMQRDGTPMAPALQQVDEAISAAISPKGDYLAVGRKNGVIDLVEVRTGRVLRQMRQVDESNVVLRLRGRGIPVSLLAFSPDGKTLVSQYGSRRFRAWSVPGGAPEEEIARRILSPAMRDPNSNTPRYYLSHHEAYFDIYTTAFSPTGDTAVVGGYALANLYLASTRQEGSVRELVRKESFSASPWIVSSAVFTRDGASLLIGTKDGRCAVRLIDVSTGTEKWRTELPADFKFPKVCLDSAGRKAFVVETRIFAAYRVDLATGTLEGRLTVPGGPEVQSQTSGSFDELSTPAGQAARVAGGTAESDASLLLLSSAPHPWVIVRRGNRKGQIVDLGTMKPVPGLPEVGL